MIWANVVEVTPESVYAIHEPSIKMELRCTKTEFNTLFVEFFRHYNHINSPVTRNIIRFPLKCAYDLTLEYNKCNILVDPLAVIYMKEDLNISNPEKYIQKHFEKFLKFVCNRYSIDYDESSFKVLYFKGAY